MPTPPAATRSTNRAPPAEVGVISDPQFWMHLPPVKVSNKKAIRSLKLSHELWWLATSVSSRG
jgi:hypothetical protein